MDPTSKLVTLTIACNEVALLPQTQPPPPCPLAFSIPGSLGYVGHIFAMLGTQGFDPPIFPVTSGALPTAGTIIIKFVSRDPG
ncbi:hypothetical protein ElyMa_005777300 [Elysia marginata]|uniref:Uncharacterized protein n=1 Tax=Elysia marginata TaxID=1093978 RepID=A0AAV4FR50_9GAST|nr:hypothetical protein ElyMa_005777300 [Elysia marginata]